MTCEISQSLLHGYLDGELDPLRSEEFERHLESCSHCIAQLEAQESLRATIHAAQLYERAPASLVGSVRRQVASAASARSLSSPPFWRWMTLAAAAAALLAAGYWGVSNLRSSWLAVEPTALNELVDAHVRSLQPGHLTDVMSTDQHTVKPWFDGKLDYIPPVRDLGESGFPLVGGRLDVLNGKTVAVLIYGRRKHYIDVFVWPESNKRAEIPAAGTRNGFQWMYSRAHGMEFCAVSDVSAPDLQSLLELLGE